MKEILKLGAILSLVCIIAASALGMTHELTKDKIAEQRFIENQKAKKAVLELAETFEDLDEKEFINITSQVQNVAEIAIAKDSSGTFVGYVVKTLPNGYGGKVEVITGVGADMKVTGIRIGNHQETPGLGAKAKEEPFYGQFAGFDASAGIGYNEIDAISGATITSNAVTDGVNIAIETINLLGGGDNE